MNHDAVRATLHQADEATRLGVEAQLRRLDELLAVASGDSADAATVEARALVEQLHSERSACRDNSGFYTWYCAVRARLGNAVQVRERR